MREQDLEKRIEVEFSQDQHEKIHREKAEVAIRQTQERLKFVSLLNERKISREHHAIRKASAREEENLDAKIHAALRKIRTLKRQQARQDDLKANIVDLQKRLETHLSDGLAKQVDEMSKQRDILRNSKAAIQLEVSSLQVATKELDELRDESQRQSEQLASLAAREVDLQAKIVALKQQISKRGRIGRGVFRRRVNLDDQTALYVDEPRPPQFANDGEDEPDSDEEYDIDETGLILASGKGPSGPNDVAPGEEINAPWRRELSRPIMDLRITLEKAMAAYFWIKESTRCRLCTIPCSSMFVSTRTGNTGCANCRREQMKLFTPCFEDPNFDSIIARLDMNVSFEAAMEAVLKILREDLNYVMHEPIARIRTRFSVYTKLLKMQNTQQIPQHSPAVEAAHRIATIWRERTRRRRESLASETSSATTQSKISSVNIGGKKR